MIILTLYNKLQYRKKYVSLFRDFLDLSAAWTYQGCERYQEHKLRLELDRMKL